MFGVVVIALAIAVMIWAIVRQPDRAVVLRRTGFGLMALSTFLLGAFIVGETFTDPGGWKAVGLVAAWVVPLAGLSVLAWLRPGLAVYVFAVLAAAVIGMSVWFAASPGSWRAFEDQHGPIRMVITFVLVSAIALLGLKRTAAAGMLLIVVGIVPVAISSLGNFLGFSSLSIVSAAPVITGVLYLVSAHLARRPMPPARSASGPAELPKVSR